MPDLNLTADCEQCCALCCVAPGFVQSPEFAISKQAHAPCPNLEPDFRCKLHAELGDRGFAGCVTYDCYGAGQYITQTLFEGQTWPALADPTQMFDSFMLARDLFEQLSLLETALKVETPTNIQNQLRARVAHLESLATNKLDDLLEVDVAAERAATLQVLQELAPHLKNPDR